MKETASLWSLVKALKTLRTMWENVKKTSEEGGWLQHDSVLLFQRHN